MVASSEDSDESQSTPSTNYHAEYNDPEADLVLETSDKVYFRLHTYHMRSWSTYFRELSEISSELHGTSSKQFMPFDITERDLYIILQLHDPDSICAMPWKQTASALEAGERWGFTLLPLLVVAKSDKHAQKAPWAVFEFASPFEYLALAKLAISYFHEDPKINCMSAATFAPTFFSEVPGDYVSALYRAMGRKDRWAILDKESDWEEIAAALKL